MIQLVLQILSGAIAVFFLLAATISLHEREKRAAILFFSSSLVFLVIGMVSILGHIPVLPGNILTYCIAVGVFTLFFPYPGTKRIIISKPQHRIDERITMFSRAELEPGSDSWLSFYHAYPYLEKTDKKWRQQPGLGKPGSRFYSKLPVSAAEASFESISFMRDFRHFKGKKHAENSKPEQHADYIHHWLKLLGAYDSGICQTQPYHWYSIKGRGKKYGKQVHTSHQRAIALVTPMNKNLVNTAPQAPSMTESAHQYAVSGMVAIQLAAFISRLGYDATAHIDGAYEMVMPLVARDAGLGTIGRMGILMHPKLGPRCRIAAVSTNMPLPVDKAIPDKSLIDFCRICQKCTNVCPSAAIPKGKRKEIKGVLRWKINQEACYTYWTKAGTDCARCMSVCPYSHHNNILHRFIRMGIRNNILFRHMAVKMDDVFYGQKPAVKPNRKLS
jgi:reductive dehalogenase